jgi:hypothetical protein
MMKDGLPNLTEALTSDYNAMADMFMAQPPSLLISKSA